jgi:hypothetical protein
LTVVIEATPNSSWPVFGADYTAQKSMSTVINIVIETRFAFSDEEACGLKPLSVSGRHGLLVIEATLRASALRY